ICARLGDRDGAILMLRAVVAAVPSFGEARFNLALNLWNRYKSATGLRQKTDLDEAVGQLTAAVQLDSRQPKTHFALGQILADKGDLAGAAGSMLKAVSAAPANFEYRYNLA